jgi:hypothetical protein
MSGRTTNRCATATLITIHDSCNGTGRESVRIGPIPPRLGQNRYGRAEALARFRLERGSPSTTRNCISADVNPICWTVQGRKVVAVPL